MATFKNRNWAAIFKAAKNQARDCPAKCADAPSLAVFMKDVVNVKTGEKIHDEANYKRWLGIANQAEPTRFVPDEEFKEVLPVTPDNVLKAVDHYVGEYGAPASISDIQFILSIPHGSAVDKAIDRSLEKAPPPAVKGALATLEAEGKVSTTENGGFLVTPTGRVSLGEPPAKRFNIQIDHNSMKMKGSDIGLIVGSQLIAKGAEVGVGMYETQSGVGAATPLHLRISTYIPVAGAILTFLGYKGKLAKKDSSKLFLASLGAHFLSQGIDLGRSAASGVPFAVVGPTPVFQMAPPGYVQGATGGVGGFRDMF